MYMVRVVSILGTCPVNNVCTAGLHPDNVSGGGGAYTNFSRFRVGQLCITECTC